VVALPVANDRGGIVMTIASLNSHPRPTAVGELFVGNDVRTLVARQLGIDIKRVTDEAHFTDDLRANWLDRLELMIAIEDQFADVEMTENDFDQIDIVGDLIRYVESMCPGRRRHARAEDLAAYCEDWRVVRNILPAL
jgi:acyl carrier protein